MGNVSEKTVIYYNDTGQDAIVCPFTQSNGKRVGHTLLAMMFLLVPIILLLYLILAS